MPRIAGVDIPGEKRIVISLTYIFGISKNLSQKALKAVGINESIFSGTINVFPNPSIGRFTVEVIGNIGQAASLENCNVLGEKVLQYEIKNPKSEIDLSSQAKGIYCVKFHIGTAIYNKKIVLQ